MRSLSSDNDNIKNYLFHRTNLQLRPQYKNDLETVHQTEIIQQDSFVNYEPVINEMVSNNTRGMIKDLLEPATFNSMTSLVLLNTVFFDQQWKKPFEKTKQASFCVSPGDCKKIDFMYHQNQQAWTFQRKRFMDRVTKKASEIEILELDFENDYAIRFIKPKNISVINPWSQYLGISEK